MFTSNPFADLSASIPVYAMQAYVVAMFILVVVGTVLDMMHKKSAQYFFENAKKAESQATKSVSSGDKVSMAVGTVASEVLTSSEFANPTRRMSHLMTMYGFIIFVVSTVALIFGYTGGADAAPSALAAAWHIGAILLAAGGYWFWFAIRVDVSAEGYPWYRVSFGDMFILSLLATSTFGLIWSATQGSTLGWITFCLFILSSTVLFGGVMWSKFAHMFFKPAAAYQKRVTRADGSREGLPADYDLTDPAVQAKFPDIPEYMGKSPEYMGHGIRREKPQHY